MLYAYVSVSLTLGVLSNFVKARWAVLALGLAILAGFLIDTWRYIDVAKWGLWQTISRTLFTGVFWYVVPSLLFFILPFLGGRYGCQLVLKMVLRSARS